MALKQVYLDKLRTCDPRLIAIVTEVEKTFPLIVVCGHRGKEDQNAAYAAGRSKLRWPRSRHNTMPSEAVDLAPLPLNWDDDAAFKRMAEAVKREAARQGVAITWGGDWRFYDPPHFELTR